MTKVYDADDWFWFVDGDTTRVFSSAAGAYLSLSDPAFVAWSADGTAPSVTDTASLGASLSFRPTDPAMLDAYKAGQAGKIIARTTFRILFNHENRLRAIERALGLNGSPPNLSQAQALAAIKALM